MFEKILGHIDDILKEITLQRVLLTLLLTFGLLMIYGMYENRQRIYEGILKEPIIGDYKLEEPSTKGTVFLNDYVKRDKNIMLLTLIDADPLSNQRVPVYRVFGSETVKSIIERGDETNNGVGPLFNSNSTNNSQMLAIMNGEMICGPVSDGMFSLMFNGVERVITYSCRVPLPPAFRRTTGWFSIHLRNVPEDMDKFKFEALNMSLTYYNMEIASKEPLGVTGR